MPKLFVRNFPWETTEGDIAEYFNAAGFEVEGAQIIMDAVTKRSKGFGFVQLVDEDQNVEAMAQLDGKPFKGRDLNVKPANPPTNPPSHRN